MYRFAKPDSSRVLDRVVVATSALGLRFDDSNVVRVIFAGVPDCMLALDQGWAGQEGEVGGVSVSSFTPP